MDLINVFLKSLRRNPKLAVIAGLLALLIIDTGQEIRP